MTKKRYYFLILILGALTALAPFSIDMYLPGFPGIARSFRIDTARVSLSLSSFFIGISLGQVLYGPLIDRFGRKPPLYAGLVLYLAASAGCAFAPSINFLIGLRFLQALGSCSAGVVSLAMVRDLFPVKDNAKVISLLLLVLGASPLVAPSVGGLITSSFGWRTIFVALFLIALLILITVILLLPESHQPDRSVSLKARPIVMRFWHVLKIPQFYTYALGGGIAYSGLFTYVSDSPSIYLVGYGVSHKTYGWIFAVLSIGFFGISQSNRILSRYFKPERIVFGCVAAMLAVSLIFLLGLQEDWFGIAGVSVMIFLLLSCLGTANPVAAALSMAPFEEEAGTAASLFGLIRWGVAGFSSVVVSLFKSSSAVPLAGIMAGTALISLIVLWLGNRFSSKLEMKQLAIQPADGRIPPGPG
jgi:DHA1 family bicyclomycin/chloramphenicol resistance-like MFS transporter